MKIYIANDELGRIGGGWTFIRHFAEGMGSIITANYNEADIYFIAGPTMVQRDDVQKAKQDGKKIVLRIDNAVRNSRNRNTGMSRMSDFARMADLIIYQSKWARDYLAPFLGKSGAVILNGINLADYHDSHADSENNILYSRFNRDETKNFEVARYWFSKYQLKHPEARLHIVGQFSDELRAGNFDFYNGEKYEFYGVVSPQSLASLYSFCSLLYTYYNDACSNTLIEALACKCAIVGDPYYRSTGGAAEIIDAYYRHGREYFSAERMCREYLEAMGKL